MTLNDLLPFIGGLAAGLLAVAGLGWIKKRQGEVFGDELTQQIKNQASTVAYVIMILLIGGLLVRDLSAGRAAGKSMVAALAASPFTWLFVIGLVAWFGAMVFYGWRAGLYHGQARSQIYLVLAILVLFMGLLPVPWAALAQLIAAIVLVVAGAIWFLVIRPAE